jgi:putative alpha-1,2-mannosidase
MKKLVDGVDRRSFLKSSGLAVGAAIVGGGTAEAVEAEASANAAVLKATATEFIVAGAASEDGLVSLVSLFQGTDSTYAFSRGNTLPIAARPFGMAHWTLQSYERSPWMFVPGERRIQGFRLTHQLSPWLGDYGHAVFLPVCGETKLDAGARASSYRPEDAKLLPHSMQMRLLRYGADVELIPTERCALMTASFSKADAPGWIVDIPGDHANDWKADEGRHSIQFTSRANEGGVPADFATYYVMQFSTPWKSAEIKTAEKHHAGLVSFPAGTKAIEVRIATSFISFEQAQRNLDLELGTKTAEQVRSEGAAAWYGRSAEDALLVPVSGAAVSAHLA